MNGPELGLGVTWLTDSGDYLAMKAEAEALHNAPEPQPGDKDYVPF
jgi:hypothetical protein